MSGPRVFSRDELQRITHAADQYRRSFRAVQQFLHDNPVGRLPQWVFAVTKLPAEELAQLSPELAQLELERRGWRVALHSLVELLALSEVDGPGADPSSTMDQLLDQMDGDDAPHHGGSDANPSLDAFIAIVDYAKTANVMYLNGQFEPVRMRPGTRGGAEDE